MKINDSLRASKYKVADNTESDLAFRRAVVQFMFNQTIFGWLSSSYWKKKTTLLTNLRARRAQQPTNISVLRTLSLTRVRVCARVLLQLLKINVSFPE